MRNASVWVVGVVLFVVTAAAFFVVGCSNHYESVGTNPPGNYISELAPVTSDAAVGFDPEVEEPRLAANERTVVVPRGMSPVGTEHNSLGLTNSIADATVTGFGGYEGDYADPILNQPGDIPLPNEELWVIARGGGEAEAKPSAAPPPPPPPASSMPSRRSRWSDAAEGGRKRADDLPPPRTSLILPRTGCLATVVDDAYVPMPLEHTDVRGSIVANIAAIDVTQKFSNPYAGKIEAVYVFPLPDDAAVSGFVMTIGERRIRGIIREREEAERIYTQARARGHAASLLTQERPNIFTQRVANIEPGRTIDVEMTYFHTLAYRDGWFEFAFPMVVGPRYNPGHTTDGVGAVGRGNAGASGQETEVQYLAPGERSGHDIALAIDINAGVAIDEIECTSHRVDIVRRNRGDNPGARVAIAKNDTIPNKDFVLRFRVAGDEVRSSLIAQAAPRMISEDYGEHTSAIGGYFTMMLVPPREMTRLARVPMELVFVLDCSGSMSGEPLEQSKAAVREALDMMGPDDAFQIIRFSESASAMGSEPLAATRENIRHGKRYVDSLNSEGGTEMIQGIRAALNFAHDPRRLRFVVFLTDGFIGNETDILAEVHRLIGPSRVFSFGVGSSPNRYLLDRMAKMGRGSVAYLGLKDDGAKVMRSFFNAASHPALTDVRIEWGAMQAHEVFPGTPPEALVEDSAAWRRPGNVSSDLPDLFARRPVIISGRFDGQISALPSSVRVRARVEGSERVIDVPVRRADDELAATAMQKVWARQKILAMNEWAVLPAFSRLSDGVRDVALRHGLMSAFTAFVAVDSASVTAGTTGTTVNVAVPVPEGVKYDTTVSPTQQGGEMGVWRQE